MTKTKKIAIAAVMTALALALSYAENFLPLQIVIPVPGLKLGLANIVTLAALYTLGAPAAFIITIARCFLGALYSAGITTLWFSLCGGLISLGIMTSIKRFSGRFVSIWGISVAGAAAHNTGQILAAWAALGSAAVFSYLPFLLFASVATGAVTAACAGAVIKTIKTSGI